MTDLYRDPNKEPQDEGFEDRQTDPMDFPTEIAGPGGRTTNRENNERGILDAVIIRAKQGHITAPLGCDHSHRQGIYTTNYTEY